MALERVSGTNVIDVLDHVLDKGIVIDAWVRVSIVGVDLLTIDARVIIASIESYLHHAGRFSELAARRITQPRALKMPSP